MYHFVRILLICFLCLISVLLHELGHAFCYRISSGKAGWKVITGSGPRMIGKSKYIFCLIPAGGYFIPKEAPERNKAKVLMYAGGPILSLMQAVLYGIIYFCFPEFVRPGSNLYEILLSVSAFLFYFNFFQCLFTVIPIRYRVVCRGFESDGLQIVHALKNKESQESHMDHKSNTDD